MKKSLFIILCFLNQAIILQSESIQCECVHLTEPEKCKKSAKCRWNEMEERCSQSANFSLQNQITSYCAQFAEEECVQEEKCAFNLGKCIDFVNCESFTKEKCNQSSYQCISDGKKCIPKGFCSDYITQIACQSQNSQGKYCKWIKKNDNLNYCEDVEECQDLPMSMKFDSDCRKQIDKCTISTKGGCQISQKYCNLYQQKEQCYFNLNMVECFWDEVFNKCSEKICINKQASLYQECQKIQPICTTNGVNCIEKLDCNQYQNPNSCVEDKKGNKCVFYQEKCYQKNCMSAPNFINKMIECQVFYQNNIVCVPKQLGGCKIIPLQCDELETEDSCKQIQELSGKKCIWDEQQKFCRIRQCSDAPLQYNHIECVYWLNEYECIGGLQNGCIENFDDCSKILNPKSCIKDKLNRKCVIENQRCVEEKCENFKFPFYNNIYTCENKLKSCTYSLYSKTCINKVCSQLEDRQCNFDYQMNKCIRLSGCIHKKCEYASVYYTSNEECEGWDIRCTVNAGVINGISYKNGCIIKYLDCTDFKYQSQCLTTLQGIPCIWNQSLNQCQFHNCQNAPLTLSTLVECKKWVQYHNIKCINKQIGGCIDQSSNCQGLKDKVQCDVGSLQGPCFWNITANQCENRTCANAQNVSSNYSCRQWLSSCIFKSPNSCESENNQILCSQFPKSNNFDSHQECQSWNPKCTLKYGNACFAENCSNYPTQEQCKFGEDGDKCQWVNSQCQIVVCTSSPNQSNEIYCKAYSPNCTYFNTSQNCQNRQLTCNQLTDSQQCQYHSKQEKCIWNTTGNLCYAEICNDSSDLATKSQSHCENRQFKCNYNEATQNCEDLQTSCFNVGNPTHLNCYLKNKKCIFNELSNKCEEIKLCSDATTYNNYTCQEIKDNQVCQIKNFTSGCQALADLCSQYIHQSNCILDIKKKQCYWSVLLQICLDLQCSIIEDSLSTHNECQQFSLNCTLNFDNSHSCMDLQECEDYIKKDQCYINKYQQTCSWVRNRCIFDVCKSSPLGIYTQQICQEQYDKKCTINEDRSGCITKLDFCNQYNKFQCLTPNQRNIDEVECFWDQSSGDCKEVLCHQANDQIRELIECEQFNQNCQTKICKMSLCDDYKYELDIQCSIALSNNKCRTDGKQCVERTLCQDVNNKAGCTFAIDFKNCIWLEVENRCVNKTCDTASININSHQECQDYLIQCTNKIGGGCIKITTCYSISSQEACVQDQDKEQCMWDFNNKKCIYLECYTFCGDGILGNQEECDDGNLIPYDGCYRCRIQCQYGCNNCIENICQECNQGFELDQKGNCSEICGDGLIVGQEECDDMNNIENDGCYQCRFQCHQQCLHCIFGICDKCDFGWEQYDNQCISVCGNALTVHQFEECDDGNTDDNDGCNSQCRVEQDWVCYQSQTTLISECKQVLHPQIILQNISQKKDSQQIIKLLFNQQVQLKDDIRFEDFLQINVTQNVQFQLIIQPVVQASLLLKQVEYHLYITLLQKVNYPFVSIQLNQSIVINSQKQELTKLIETISLGTPLILSLDQQSRLNNTIAFNQIMIYVFIGSSSLSVLTGNFDLFFNMLALLQQLSYVRYLSVPFPSHLDQYLKVFKVVSFQPLYDQLEIDQLFKKLNFGKVPFIQSKNIKKQDQEFNNSFFLINAKSFYFTMFLSISFYLLAQIIINTNSIMIRLLCKIKQFNQLKKFYQVYQQIKNFGLKTSRYFIYSGLIKAFISSQYQLMYSAYNQCPEYKFIFKIENLFETFNSINALICIILPHIFLFKSITVQQKKITSQVLNKYFIFYENVKPNYWSRFCIPFSMIKVSIYMAIICFLFNSAIIQSISLIMLCIIYCYYLIAVQPLMQKIELIRLILREITFLLIVSTFFPYCLSFDDEVVNILGWIHIGLFSFIIGSNILLDVVKQIFNIYSAYKTKMIKKELQKRKYLINGLQQFIRADINQKTIYNGPLSIGFEVQSNNQSQIIQLH